MSDRPPTKSAELYRRACRVMPGGNTRTTVFRQPHPAYAVRGAGCRVTDVDGNVRIDALGNYTALIHGYGHRATLEAVSGQLEAGACFGMPTESEVRLAELLCGRLGSVDHLRFTNSGTEAVMNAVKAARAFTGRPKLAKCEGAYHGTYDPAEVSQDVGAEGWGPVERPNSVANARGTPAGVLGDTVVIPFNDVGAAEHILRQHAADLAAVLVDVMPNRAGLVPASAPFLEMLRRVTRDLDALLILDEVITFRLGYHGAQGRLRVHPDLTALGKIIGGGLPIGAVGGRRDVMQVFDPSGGRPAVPHGGTFSANPLSMTAGLAALGDLTPAAFARLEELTQRLEEGIRSGLARHGVEGQITGLGSLRRIHLTATPLTDYRSVISDVDSARRVSAFANALFDEGVMIGSNGLMATSTAMTAADIDEIVGAVDRALARDAVHLTGEFTPRR